MNRREITQAMRQLMVGHFACNPARVHDDAELGELGPCAADGAALLFAQIKARFQISISDREMAFCQTVGTTIDLVENKVELRRLVSGGRLQR